MQIICLFNGGVRNVESVSLPRRRGESQSVRGRTSGKGVQKCGNIERTYFINDP